MEHSNYCGHAVRQLQEYIQSIESRPVSSMTVESFNFSQYCKILIQILKSAQKFVISGSGYVTDTPDFDFYTDVNINEIRLPYQEMVCEFDVDISGAKDCIILWATQGKIWNSHCVKYQVPYFMVDENEIITGYISTNEGVFTPMNNYCTTVQYPIKIEVQQAKDGEKFFPQVESEKSILKDEEAIEEIIYVNDENIENGYDVLSRILNIGLLKIREVYSDEQDRACKQIALNVNWYLINLCIAINRPWVSVVNAKAKKNLSLRKKPAINSIYKTLVLDTEKLQSFKNPKNDTEQNRASPRSHSRRGHYRKYGTKTVWINETTVNPGNAQVKKTYRVEKNAEHKQNDSTQH